MSARRIASLAMSAIKSNAETAIDDQFRRRLFVIFPVVISLLLNKWMIWFRRTRTRSRNFVFVHLFRGVTFSRIDWFSNETKQMIVKTWENSVRLSRTQERKKEQNTSLNDGYKCTHLRPWRIRFTSTGFSASFCYCMSVLLFISLFTLVSTQMWNGSHALVKKNVHISKKKNQL